MKPFTTLIAAALVLGLAACGSSSSSGYSSSSASTSSTAPSAPQKAGGTLKVAMTGIAFAPATLNAKVGQTVEWTNDDPVPHNVTYRSGPKFASSATMAKGAKYTVKLDKPGTINYVCTFHPNMVATIVVSK